MNLSPEMLARCIHAELVQPAPASPGISGAFTCDLLSEVMAHAPAGSLLITVLSHSNVVAVSIAADLPAVLVCQGRAIPESTRIAAAREGIALLSTSLNAFDASVAVHRALTEESA